MPRCRGDRRKYCLAVSSAINNVADRSLTFSILLSPPKQEISIDIRLLVIYAVHRVISMLVIILCNMIRM